MKKLLIGLTILTSFLSHAETPCDIYVTGIVGMNKVELRKFEGESLADYLYTGEVNNEIRVAISESADVPDYTIEIYDRKRGIRLSTDRTLRYETGANGVDEKIVINAYCIN